MGIVSHVGEHSFACAVGVGPLTRRQSKPNRAHFGRKIYLELDLHSHSSDRLPTSVPELYPHTDHADLHPRPPRCDPRAQALPCTDARMLAAYRLHHTTPVYTPGHYLHSINMLGIGHGIGTCAIEWP